MSFKIHLFIISLIVIVVYFMWQTLDKMPETVAVPAAPAVQQSEFSISITHASWGLNCKNRFRATANPAANNSAFMDNGGSNDKLREDNVLTKVSSLCNGQLQCSVPVNTATLGDDPAPGCGDKSLQVEYRCFSYDRPWDAQASYNGTLTINCDRSAH